MSKKGTLGRKGKHWSQRVREIVVVKSANGSFNVCIEGGAENGEFARIGSFKQDKVKYKQGKLHVNDVILEVSDVAIAGCTLPDVVSLIKKTGDVLKMQVVKPGKYSFTRSMNCRVVENTLNSFRFELIVVLKSGIIVENSAMNSPHRLFVYECFNFKPEHCFANILTTLYKSLYFSNLYQYNPNS
jgi:hypothetical protein